MTEYRVPTFEEVAAPTIQALKDLGGSASIRELSEAVAGLMALPDDVLEEFGYRAGWTRTYLKKMGAIDNSSRGIWSLTEYGRNLDSTTDFRREFRAIARGFTRQPGVSAAADLSGSDSSAAEEMQVLTDTGSGHAAFDEARESDWHTVLLATLREMPPDAFERLCQWILREKGFTRVEVTKKTGDEGIDGTGVLRVNLISFQVVFQCKRYTGSVGSGAIRDFRGAMTGRADKGLILTTSYFTRDARREAVRDGAAAIDLIDGTELCELLKELGLGVRMVEQVEPDFFEKI